MDTNRIKRFATEARNKLKEGIAAKIRTLPDFVTQKIRIL